MWFYLLFGSIIAFQYFKTKDDKRNNGLSKNEVDLIENGYISKTNERKDISDGNSQPVLENDDLKLPKYINNINNFEYSYPNQVLQDDISVNYSQEINIKANKGDAKGEFKKDLNTIKFDPNFNLTPRSDIIKNKYTFQTLF